MNFSNHRLKKKPEFMIIPMIDIIFFLLVFFMMNSLQTVAQKALAVQLPQAQSATAPAQLPSSRTLNVWIIPVTVPSSPSRGAIVTIALR